MSKQRYSLTVTKDGAPLPAGNRRAHLTERVDLDAADRDTQMEKWIVEALRRNHDTMRSLHRYAIVVRRPRSTEVEYTYAPARPAARGWGRRSR